jgi:hypothetical protein
VADGTHPQPRSIHFRIPSKQLATLLADFIALASRAILQIACVRATGLGMGGTLAILSRTRLFQAASLCAFCGAAIFVVYGVFVLTNADWSHGSTTGNIVIGAFGVLLLIIAPILFMLGIMSWKTSKSI